MKLLEIIFLAFSVSLDAFAVSICKGINSKQKLKTALTCGIWFSAFQTIMPLLGFFLGTFVLKYISSIDHWIVLAILTFLGINMIKEALKNNAEEQTDSLGIKTMFILSFATSVDALAVGITLAITNSNLVLALSFIFGITFVMCFIGSLLGKKLGEKNQKIATILGGIVLIVLGIKIVIEHLI